MTGSTFLEEDDESKADAEHLFNLMLAEPRDSARWRSFGDWARDSYKNLKHSSEAIAEFFLKVGELLPAEGNLDIEAVLALMPESEAVAA